MSRRRRPVQFVNPWGLIEISPEKAAEINLRGDGTTAAQYRKAAQNRRLCCNCDEVEWVAAGLGMCFPCTTGETDGSDDYEVVA